MSRGRFLLVLLFLLLLVQSPVPAFSAPKIEIKEKAFNFKETIEGQTVEHTFQV